MAVCVTTWPLILLITPYKSCWPSIWAITLWKSQHKDFRSQGGNFNASCRVPAHAQSLKAPVVAFLKHLSFTCSSPFYKLKPVDTLQILLLPVFFSWSCISRDITTAEAAVGRTGLLPRLSHCVGLSTGPQAGCRPWGARAPLTAFPGCF